MKFFIHNKHNGRMKNILRVPIGQKQKLKKRAAKMLLSPVW
ncbi:MAG TPA: hypothetical protein PK695_10300 [Chitinophagaceae bacterium]|jgi:hypothetical protein|nr:hypothetical protein [Chitinophagaceae bacterium]HNA91629.1 hypothetical protein [Chitinophagaceae bacterium]HNC38005.1 hypothetical protein [Chitinophagaceae bacterium]HNF47172.1 hypothetical protein [Chitinophagaceae bacterium]HNJ56729.1 hypothetical protein [Chitinophagaceae bacterium]